LVVDVSPLSPAASRLVTRLAGTLPLPGSRKSVMSEQTPTRQDPPASTAAGRRRVPRTRTSGAYKSMLAGAVVLALLLIFILENTKSVKISYLGESSHMPLGVALLLAAVAGALLVGIVGGVRILQLRRRVKRHAKAAGRTGA